MEYRGLYVSATPDCEPNEGGYYCQVYADEDYGDQKTAIFNHKLNDKPKELWYSTVRNQEQISTERTQNYEDYFFRYLLYERMAGYLPVRGI